MQVGFIGLGRMGSGMAANLIAAGHTLTVYNRTPAKAEPLLAKGAHLAKTPGEAARGAGGGHHARRRSRAREASCSAMTASSLRWRPAPSISP